MKRPLDVLLFVEDPGAANYLAGIPATLEREGYGAVLLAQGPAAGRLEQLGCPFEAMDPAVDVGSLLDEHPPGMVIVGTSENLDSPGLLFIKEARARGIPSVGAVDALSNAAWRFRGRTHDPMAFAPDWLLVPDEWTKKAYAALGFKDDSIGVCGHPHYDQVLKDRERLVEEGAGGLRDRLFPDHGGRRLAVFVAEISTGLNPEQYSRSEEYTLHGWGGARGRTQIVIEEFLSVVRRVRPHPCLVLRLHPKNSEEEFSGYLDDFDAVSRGAHPEEVVFCADLVVGMTSMLLLEAALLGSPTLSIVPRACEMEWLPSIRMGLTTCVTSREALEGALPEMLSGGGGLWTRPSAGVVTGSLERAASFLVDVLVRPNATPAGRTKGERG